MRLNQNESHWKESKKSCVAKTLPDGLKMWVPALDGQGGWGELLKHLEI